MLPLAFAQDAQQPRFPQASALVGYGGVSTLVGHPVPVRSWLMLFRPQVWGYFVGRDFGMAWHWWFRLLGLFYATFLVLLLLTGGRTWIALGLALSFVFAPFFQFWCFSCEPLLAMAFLAFWCFASVVQAGSRRSLLLYGVLLAWSAGCFGLSVLYPPFQVSLAWLLVFLAGGWLVAEWTQTRERGRLVLRASIVAASLAIAAGAVATFYVQNREALRLLSETVYPGQRLSSGGDLPLPYLLNSFFTPFLGTAWWSAFSNISDSGSFFFFLPMIAAIVGVEYVRTRRPPHPLLLALAAFWLLAFLYALLGLPQVLATVLFGGRVAGYRMMLAMGTADLVALALFLSGTRLSRFSRITAAVLALLWVLVVLATGIATASRIEAATWRGPALIALPLLAVAVPLALRWRWSIVPLAVLSLAATAWFNPLVRGGSDYLRTNPFSRKVLELDRAGGGRTRWVVYDDATLPNLFRAIGVRAINGLHYYPQLELWSRLGLVGAGPELERLYNRYAHVTFEVAAAKRLRASIDRVVVSLHPDHETFARLDLDYVVYVGPNRSVLDGTKRLRFVESVGDKHIFRVIRGAGEP